MKIGIDARLWSQGGVGRYIRNLVINLSEIDAKNDYVLFALKDDLGNIKENVNNEKWKIVESDIHWHTISEQIKFSRVLNKEKLELVHFPYFSVPFTYRKPYVVTIHDLIFHHYFTGSSSTLPLWLLGFKVIAYRLIVANASRFSKKIIAVSQFTKKDIVSTLRVSEKKINVVYEASDDFKIVKNKEIKYKNYFLYVGNVFAHKNVGSVLKSFKRISEEKKDLTLIFVGKEDFLYKKLKEHVSKNFKDLKIIFLHNVNDEELSTLYRNAKALIRPSLMEGFSLPPLEALESEGIVLASDIPVHREILKDCVFYFDQFNTDDILDKMKMVLELSESDKNKMVKKGLELVKKYSWKKTAQETLSIYESSLGL